MERSINVWHKEFDSITTNTDLAMLEHLEKKFGTHSLWQDYLEQHLSDDYVAEIKEMTDIELDAQVEFLNEQVRDMSTTLKGKAVVSDIRNVKKDRSMHATGN